MGDQRQPRIRSNMRGMWASSKTRPDDSSDEPLGGLKSFLAGQASNLAKRGRIRRQRDARKTVSVQLELLACPRVLRSRACGLLR